MIEPKIRPMMIAVMPARTVMRRRATPKAASTALPNRSVSRFSWLKAWTIFIAPSVSDTIAPISAILSCELREKLRTRPPSNRIGTMITGMASRSDPASLGDKANR